jgi:hypothetical protein
MHLTVKSCWLGVRGYLRPVSGVVILLDNTIEEMMEIVKKEHIDNNRKSDDVGRKEAAYRGCYV